MINKNIQNYPFKCLVAFILLLETSCDLASPSDPIDDVTGCYIFNGPGYDDKACFKDDGTFTQSRSTGEEFNEYYNGKWNKVITSQEKKGKPFIAISAEEMLVIEIYETGFQEIHVGVYMMPRQYTKTRIFFEFHTDTTEIHYLKVLDQ